jgi:hypothetical protein
MKQVIFGFALVAVGMCTLTKRSSADEYYNRGSNIFGERDSTEVGVGGGSVTGIGRKVGGANRKSGSLAKKTNPSLDPGESDELTYNIKIDNEEVENIVEDF